MKLPGQDAHKRASRVFNPVGKAYTHFQYLEVDKNASIKTEADKVAQFKQLQETLQENGDPDYYVKLFTWLDPNAAELHYPSRDLAVECLDNRDMPNEEMKVFAEKAKALLSGQRPMTVVHTHDHIKHVFDPQTETVPGNPDSEPSNGGMKLDD